MITLFMILIFYMPDDTSKGGKEPKKSEVVAPENYTPLPVSKRKDWNSFLDFLDKQGIAGHPELDERNRTLGLSYLDRYKKMNPNFSITPEDIRNIQYDQYLLRKGENFPTMSNEQLNLIRQHLAPNYLNREVSPVDNWLGSITSKLYYPKGKIVGSANQDFGENIEQYSNALLGK